MHALLLVLLIAGSGDTVPGHEPTGDVRRLLDAGRYEEAEAQAAAAEIQAADGTPSDRYAAQQLYVEALLRNGRGGESRTLLLATAVAKSGDGSGAGSRAASGTSRRLLGLTLFQAARYAESAAALRAAVDLHGQSVGAKSPEVATDLEGLALALMRLERQNEAAAAIDRAVSIEAQLDPTGARMARALTTRALIWQHGGKYRLSGEDVRRALALRENLAPLHPETARVLTYYGDQLWFEGDLAGGRDYLARALDVGERTLRRGHPDLAVTLRFLAILTDQLGNIDEAKALRERGLRIAEAAFDNDHQQVAFQRNDLAISAIERGELNDAKQLLQQVLASHLKRLGPNHPEVAETLHNLGDVSSAIGDFAEAARFQRQALSIWTRTIGADHPMVPWALVALGAALAREGRHQEAVPVFERALAARTRTLGRTHVHVATTQTALASSLVAVGRLARAATLANRSVETWERAKGADGLSAALFVRARVEAARGAFDRARQDYERAMTVRLPAYGPAHASIAEGRAGLALALAAMGQREAVPTALEAERVSRDHLRLTSRYLSERQALGYAAARARGLDLAVSVMSPGDANVVLDSVIKGRSIVLDEMAERQRLRASAGSAAIAPLWAEFTKAGQRLANLAVAGPGDLDGEKYGAVLRGASRERELAETALAERSATLRRDFARLDAGLDAVRAALPEGTVLVSFVRYERTVFVTTATGSVSKRAQPAYVAFLARPGPVATEAVPLGSAAAVDNLIATWRRTALEGLTAAGAVRPGAESSLRRIGLSLRARLWDPIAPRLTGATRIFIVPDGAINLVPFGALPADRGQYLVDSSPPLHYLSSERDLVTFDAAFTRVAKGLLAIGGPTYGPLPPGTDHPSCATFASLSFPELPGARREVEDVSALWRTLERDDGPLPLVLTGARAQEGAFKQQSPGHRVLHLAMHGFFLDGRCEDVIAGTRGVSVVPRSLAGRSSTPVRSRGVQNPLLLSGLAMAGANRRAAAATGNDDGILTAEEVAALDLDGVEWAVLSACDTGLGAVRAGEGVFGLRRAFRIAGARTVIMSLWPVEDQATRSWMRALYEARLRDKLTTADAMRYASLTMLNERRAKGLSTHPLYWAGFVAAGDWR